MNNDQRNKKGKEEEETTYIYSVLKTFWWVCLIKTDAIILIWPIYLIQFFV